MTVAVVIVAMEGTAVAVAAMRSVTVEAVRVAKVAATVEVAVTVATNFSASGTATRIQQKLSLH